MHYKNFWQVFKTRGYCFYSDCDRRGYEQQEVRRPVSHDIIRTRNFAAAAEDISLSERKICT